MSMNIRIISEIAKKDISEVLQNKAAWIPMLVVPLIMVIIIPLALILLPPRVEMSMDALISESDLKFFLENMPSVFNDSLAGLNDFQTILMIVLGYMFAPMYLIFPLMVSTIIASESFAGERERKTLESLLFSPASDSELFIGKSLAAFLPSLIISWGSFIMYVMVINIASLPVFGYLWFPLPSWYPLVFWVTPALTLLGISVTVLISARVQTFMGAYQMSASLVLIVLLLFAGQMSGIVYLNVLNGLLIGLFTWFIAGALLSICIRKFNRYALISGN